MNPGKQKKNHMATSTARLPGAFFFGSPTVAVLVSVLKYRVAVIAGELPPARLDDLGVAIEGFVGGDAAWSVAAWSVGALQRGALEYWTLANMRILWGSRGPSATRFFASD